jgi:hypothetical protein
MEIVNNYACCYGTSLHPNGKLMAKKIKVKSRSDRYCNFYTFNYESRYYPNGKIMYERIFKLNSDFIEPLMVIEYHYGGKVKDVRLGKYGILFKKKGKANAECYYIYKKIFKKTNASITSFSHNVVKLRGFKPCDDIVAELDYIKTDFDSALKKYYGIDKDLFIKKPDYFDC